MERGGLLMARPLTERQREVLEFIARAVDAGMPPTLREVCAEFGWSSTQAASDHVDALERKGFVARQPRKSRGIRVLRRGS